MKILALDCSEGPASCAVVEDRKILCESFVSVPLTHSRTLIPMLTDMLKNAGLSVGEMDRLAVTVGPGSFTGLRIGVAAVKGLALGADLPCVGVSTPGAAAMSAVSLSGLICPVMDARCRQVYTALFEAKEGALTRIWEDRAVSVDDLAAALQEATAARPDLPLWLTGNGVPAVEDVLAPLGARPAPLTLRSQRASAVALLAADAEPVDASALTPVYLRLPQAERELKRKLEQQ